MNELAAAELFDARYYAAGCGVRYERNEHWLAFFGRIADRIIADIGPGTVMDAGCALGLLVESLRTRGVAAFGRDISSFAIDNVHPSIYGYCELGSIANPFAQRYDLIVSIEVLEHMPPDEARQAIANLCRHSDDILFSSTPFDYKEATHLNVQPPEYWAELFAQQGFYRDVDFDASFITEWAVRFRRSEEALHRIVRDYERAYWLLRKENRDLRVSALEHHSLPAGSERASSVKMETAAEPPAGVLALALKNATQELIDQDQALQGLKERSAEQELALRRWEQRWAALEFSPGYGVLRALQGLRARVAPPRSSRDHILDATFQILRLHNREALRVYGGRIRFEVSQQVRAWRDQPARGTRLSGARAGRTLTQVTVSDEPFGTLVADPVAVPPALSPHEATVDIVICVHNAPHDVQRCLEAVSRWSTQPYRVIIIDDGSENETKRLLDEFVSLHGASLFRNTKPLGYTRAANQGLNQTNGDFVVLLNSDTIVGPGWLDRMIACAKSDTSIGLVGPLSNAASWQSVPDIIGDGDWATNPLPPGFSANMMAEAMARHSARLYPRVPFLNGFCLLIRRQLLNAIGCFDEEGFGAGYGEENDYCIRARMAGWTLAVADDTYVYHAGSKSYSDARRRELCERADATLKRKHGEARVNEGVQFLATDRVLEGIRAHAAVAPQQDALIRQAGSEFGGRTLLWLLPVMTPGGGAALVVSMARIMREMGIGVAIFNLPEYQSPFEEIYPGLEVPVVYGRPEDVGPIGAQYDGVVATANVSAYWLLPLVAQSPATRLGYFIQDFEPYFYKPDSADYKIAWGSYSVIPDMHRFATTSWVQEEVRRNTGMLCGLVGPCYNSALFRPRARALPEWPDRPLRIGAMIRPATPYRGPKQTMEALAVVERKFGPQVEVRLFGSSILDPAFQALPHDFRWRHAGPLNQRQVASFLNEIDIFVDFSTYQALGATAEEAMSCGAAVIVPQAGGTNAFARHEHNCLMVDSSSLAECIGALTRLVEDHGLRTRLQKTAMQEVPAYHPHLPTYKTLRILFGTR